MPNQAPIVNVTDQTVLMNATIVATDLFSVSDPDSDPILKYRFEDFSSDVNSGYFSLNGSALTNGSMTEIDAVDLGSMFYVGGTQIATEEFLVQAWDGLLWSSVNATGVMYTTRQQITPPEATALDFTVLGNEVVAANTFVSAFDPDGYPILRYYIKDDLINNSYFKLGDTTLAQGTFHYVEASQFDELNYHGFHEGVEKIRVFAYDGSAWSPVSIANATTNKNKNSPTVEFDADIVPTRELVSVAPYLTFHDADGNSIKSVAVWDTSSHDHSGYLVLDGVQLASKQWHEIAYSDLDKLEYMGADRMMNERINVRAYDGRYWSPIEKVVLSTVFQPEIADVRRVFISQLETLDATELFSQSDAGPSLTDYEIADMTVWGEGSDISGYLKYMGNRLDVGEVYEFSSAQFNNLDFVSGPWLSRADDEVYARAFNGVFWSDWTRVTASTHPEYDKALDSGTTWLDYNYQILPEPYHVTYSFMQQFPGYDSGAATADNWHSYFNNAQRVAARRALDSVETYCNIEFDEVSDSSIQEKTGWFGGIIRFGNYTNEEYPAATLAYSSYPSTLESSGDIWINRFSPNLPDGPPTGFFGGTDWDYGDLSYTTLMHELGHAVGLKHPHDDEPGHHENLPTQTNNDMYTVMSYVPRDDFVNPSSHALYDIYEFQQKYGVNESHATGDDIYTISNTAEAGQFSQWAIWDAAGNDTLSAEGSWAGAVVDLREGSLSSIGLIENNVALAIGCIIENAVGSSMDDTIFGNEGDNVIDGGAGEDEIHGFAGTDTMTGGADNDTFVVGIADGDDFIFENQLAGWDTIQFRQFPGFDDFTEDLSFRAEDRDLVIDYTMDGGRSQGSVTINNQKWGAYRVETLRIGSAVVDLRSVYTQCTEDLQQFAVASGSTKYGSLVAPV